MKSNFFALLIGFNEYKDKDHLATLSYAEKDASDFYEVLTNPEVGGYPESNIELLRGKDITTEQIEQKLYSHVVKNRTSDDTVVVFFSGHGYIAGDEQRAYLATPDIGVFDVLKNPRKGLQMGFIHDDIFMASKAGLVILFLDCCHSGAFIPTFRKEHREQKGKAVAPNIEKNLIKDIYFSEAGRVAFVSSPKGVSSRESRDLKNGVFTYHLLDGLRGKAIEYYKNENVVTLDSLIAYVRAMTPSNQRPERYGRDTGSIILTKPVNIAEKYGYLGTLNSNILKDASSESNVQALENPIKHQFEYIDNFLQCLNDISQTNKPVNTKVLSAIRCSLDADFALVQRVDTKNRYQPMITKAISDFSSEIIDQAYVSSILSRGNRFISQEKREILPNRFGISQQQIEVETKSISKYSIVIPVRLDEPKEFIIIGGVKSENLKYGEVLGHSLMSAYQATDELNSLDTLRIETTILDNLRSDFGFLPYEIFKRRQKAFTEKLQTIVYYFEPIITLGKEIEIDSWEALARDPNTQRAPVDLFKAAELWGSDFIKALDLYCVRKAISTYANMWKEEKRHGKMDPLALNIYPQTVFFDDYLGELTRIIRTEGLIKGPRVIFEISEKRPIPKSSGDQEQGGFDEFAKRLNSISGQLNVGFAIDDFGVGHSNITGLAKLNLAHVKIDREILHHDHPETTIRYVLELVHQAHTGPVKVVVEGFDGDARISLSTLFKALNIEYVQGHLMRRASPSLKDLSPTQKKFLQQKLL